MRISFSLLFSIAILLVFSISAVLVLADDETVFDPESNVSSDSIGSRLTSADTRQIAVSYGTTYMVWQGGKNVWFRLSRDDGATWNPPLSESAYNLSVDDSAETNTDSQFPQIAVSGGGYVHVVWRQYTGDGTEIFYKRITDSGAALTFEPDTGDGGINLSNRPLGSNNPQITTSGDSVYVAWQDEFDARNAFDNPPGYLSNEILFKADKNNGQGFVDDPTDHPVNMTTSDAREFNPEVVASGDSVYVGWYGPSSTKMNIFFRASEDNGDSFKGTQVNYKNNHGAKLTIPYYDEPGTPTNISDDPSNPVDYISAGPKHLGPQMAAAGEAVYLVWTDQEPNGFAGRDTWFRASTDRGATFGPRQNLSNNSEASTGPRIAASGYSVYVTWKDDSGMPFSRSDDRGDTFQPTVVLDAKGATPAGQIFADGANVYAAWTGKSEDFSSNKRVIFKMSIDWGATFNHATIANDTNGGWVSSVSQVVASGDRAYVVWDRCISACNTVSNKNYEVWMASAEVPDSGTSLPPIGGSDNQADSDADGYIDADLEGGTDCDDHDASVNPGASEIAYDGIDQDCDGSDLTDVDGDGHNSTAVLDGTDCNDNDDTIHPDATEVAYDGIDQDCDGSDLTDVDGDGHNSTAVLDGTDCDDNDDTIHPDATEVINDGIDQDCDGSDLTPAEATENLVASVEAADLPRGTEGSLISSLDAAVSSLDRGNDETAINQLNAFINKVNAQRGKKISDEFADTLIGLAQAIIDAI